MITGEAVPVEASAGSEVTGGTLAADGRLIVEATSVGADTRSRTWRVSSKTPVGQEPRAAARRPHLRGLRPHRHRLAVLTLLGWMIVGGSGESIASGFTAAVAVLIIACPCALGLATPIAILVGTGRGAQLASSSRAPRRSNPPSASTRSSSTRPAPSRAAR
jgi:Cu+-exporting ATPase